MFVELGVDFRRGGFYVVAKTPDGQESEKGPYLTEKEAKDEAESLIPDFLRALAAAGINLVEQG